MISNFPRRSRGKGLVDDVGRQVPKGAVHAVMAMAERAYSLVVFAGRAQLGC
jgi:hypothetical protein